MSAMEKPVHFKLTLWDKKNYISLYGSQRVGSDRMSHHSKTSRGSYLLTTLDENTAEYLQTMTDLQGKMIMLEEQKPEVVMRVPKDVPDEDLKEMIPRAIKVEKIMMINQETKKWCPSMSVKVWVKGDIPNKIHLGVLRYCPTRPFILEPRHCHKCHQFGHFQECRRAPRCSLCSGNHPTKDCINKQNNDVQVDMRCINCNGGHSANSTRCPVYRMA